MARDGATQSDPIDLPAALIEALHEVLTLTPADDSQRIAKTEMVKAIQAAADARRQRIVVSQSAVGRLNGPGSYYGNLYVDRYRHGSQRQPARLRYSNDPLRDRHSSVAIADRRLQSAICR